MNYRGDIIEESLRDPSVLADVTTLNTRIEPITPQHKTPWLKQWTLHNVEISKDRVDEVAERISCSFEEAHSAWYVDFKNETTHFIIFPHKIFKIDRTRIEQYIAATQYGLSLGIPPYQVDFASNVVSRQP